MQSLYRLYTKMVFLHWTFHIKFEGRHFVSLRADAVATHKQAEVTIIRYCLSGPMLPHSEDYYKKYCWSIDIINLIRCSLPANRNPNWLHDGKIYVESKNGFTNRHGFIRTPENVVLCSKNNVFQKNSNKITT